MGIERIKRIIIANELPIRVKRTACCPFLFNNMLWPGKIDKTESSSGAPRNIEGIKSRKVWTMFGIGVGVNVAVILLLTSSAQ